MKYNYIISGQVTSADGSKGQQYIGYSVTLLVTLDGQDGINYIASGKLTGAYDINGNSVIDQVKSKYQSFDNISIVINNGSINYVQDIEGGKASLNISCSLSDKMDTGDGVVFVTINSWLWKFFLKSISGTFSVTLESFVD
jgi:hypothetical protein